MKGTRNRRQRGISLVELMVAMVVGLLLLSGVIQIFISSKATYETQERLARLQESGRFATMTLSRHLRMAGYVGCGGRGGSVFNNLAGFEDDVAYDFARGLYGSEFANTGPDDTDDDNPLDLGDDDLDDGSWSPALPADLTGNVTLGTDVLVVRGMAGRPVRALASESGNPIGSSNQFRVRHPNDFNGGDILMITDCRKSSIFQINTISHEAGDNRSVITRGGGNHTPGNEISSGPMPADQRYEHASEVARLETVAYYVGTDDGVPTLFRHVLSNPDGAAEPLIEGVENMQLLYGVDNNGNRSVDAYVTAADVEAADVWAEVIAVRFGLLVRSEQPVHDMPGTGGRLFSLAGTLVSVPDDNLQRQSFSGTVSLRNRAQ